MAGGPLCGPFCLQEFGFNLFCDLECESDRSLSRKVYLSRKAICAFYCPSRDIFLLWVETVEWGMESRDAILCMYI